MSYLVATDKLASDLFDRNRRLPRLLFVQNRQTDGARGVHVGVEQGWREFAYGK